MQVVIQVYTQKDYMVSAVLRDVASAASVVSGLRHFAPPSNGSRVTENPVNKPGTPFSMNISDV